MQLAILVDNSKPTAPHLSNSTSAQRCLGSRMTSLTLPALSIS